MPLKIPFIGDHTRPRGTDPMTLDRVRNLTENLSRQDKLRLIADLSQQLLRETPEAGKTSPGSLWGILAHLGPGPSDEDIDEMRREAWKNFPREEFYE